jgi:hypothetical protein
MAGLFMPTGLGARGNIGGSVVGGLYGGYGGGTPGSAAAPAATGIPEGPMTITQQAWGVPPATGASGCGLRAALISTAALILLGVIWWTLPRLGRRSSCDSAS